MASSQNPFSLGGWPTFPVQATSPLAFRILHPSAEGGETKAPVDILNCVVLDPYLRRFLTVGTSIPVKGMSIDPITSIQDASGSVVATVEWPSRGGRYPFIRSNGAIKIPRQPSETFLQETTRPSTRRISVEGREYAWVDGSHEYKLNSWGNGVEEPLVTVTKGHTGELSLAVSSASVGDGSLLLAVLVLVVLLPGRV